MIIHNFENIFLNTDSVEVLFDHYFILFVVKFGKIAV